MSTPRPELLSFPFGSLDEDSGRLVWSSGNQSVREVMLNILLTRPGERLMRPSFGAGLRNYIHLPNNETTRALIADSTRRAIERWEPRVTVDEITVQPDGQRLSHVSLSIHYRLKYDATREELTLSIDLGTPS